MMWDEYRGHICVTIEPGCTCESHANAFRERDRLEADLAASRAEAAALREALPDPAKLWALAEWIDALYPNDGNPEVQADLRRWARNIMALGLHPGIMAKEVLEPDWRALARPERGSGEGEG